MTERTYVDYAEDILDTISKIQSLSMAWDLSILKRMTKPSLQ